MAAPPPPRRAVSFAPYSTVHLMEDQGDNASLDQAQATAPKLWHTDEERQQSLQNMSAEVLRLRHVLGTTPPENISQDVLCQCVGIEHLLNPTGPNGPPNVLVHRRTHLNRILTNQGRCTPDELRAQSEKLTESLRDRAHELAKAYWRQSQYGMECDN